MSGTFANGTRWEYGALTAGGAAFTTSETTIHSTWTGLGALATFNGVISASNPKPVYTVDVVSPGGFPGGNLKANLSLTSVRLWISPCAFDIV
jgi:hypothetical protein